MLNRSSFIWLLLVGLMIIAAPVQSQQPPGKKSWHAIDKIPQNRPAADAWVHPQKFHAFNVDRALLQAELVRVPKEFSNEASIAPGEISLPMPDGSLARFKVVESPVMAPELAAKFPEIKTYLGQGIDDPLASVRFDVSPSGFHGQILSPKGAVYIDPYWRGDAILHTSYYKHDYRRAVEGFQCLVAGVDAAPDQPRAEADALLNSGANLRTYRLACAATGEYVAFHGGTVSAGMSAIVTAINRVTGVYEVELAIRLVLVANNNLIVYTNASTDPYSNNSPSTLLNQNQSNLDSVIGAANYDIGHVFSTGGGGLASLHVVCVSGSKAKGETGLSAPIGDAFYIDYVAHEMGHQFGGNHTFNSTAGNCSGQRNASTAYEPGSGSTIMAYAGICSSDDLQPHSDPYFHSVSFDEIIAYTTTGSGNNCPVLTATSNTAPTVSAGSNFTIPKSTPFTLTATGSDAEGDPLTFCWEERDLGAATTLTAPDNGSSPIFRSLNPTTNASRTFPTLASLLSNTSIPGEKLPTTSRTMNFRVTARDNRAGGGGVNTADMQVTVNSSAGPFLVTSPNSSVIWSNTQTVTWSVAGTTSAPINASNVNILLSTNGGNSFPIVLAANTPNDGSEVISLPNISTSAARVKVEAVGNIFFDISDSDFSIVPFTPMPVLIVSSATLVSENCSPGNNAIDPNETVTVSFALKNVGSLDTTNLVVTLLASNGVVSPSGNQVYGALSAGGGAISNSFTFTATGICGGIIQPVLQLQDGTNNLGMIQTNLTLGAVTATSLTNSNSANISIPVGGAASPYPSPVSVAGVAGTISKVTVSLLNLSHTYSADIDVLLVAPNGQTVLLMAQAGGSTSFTNVNLTFDSSASTPLPASAQIPSGTYLPSNYGTGGSLGPPAPIAPYGSTLNSLNGSSPNGTWSLYVYDTDTPDKGNIAGGWRLTLTTSIPNCCTSNLSPFISSIENQVTDEDVPKTNIAFTISDAESAVDTLIVTGNSSDSNLVLDTNLVFSGTGTNRLLTVIPSSNQFGSATITISVSDGTNISSTAFLFTVNPVNDAPIADNQDVVIAEDTATNMVLTGSDLESEVTFAILNGPTNGLISELDINSGALLYTPNTNYNGPDHFTFTVSDGSLLATGVVSITITAVNDAPVLAEISPQVVDEETLLQFTNSATDIDGNQLTFTLDPGAPDGAEINPTNGVFTWTPDESQGPGTNDITIRVTDDGSPNLSDTKTFTVTVNEVNSAPSLVQVSNKFVYLGMTLSFTNLAGDSDVPTNSLEFSFDLNAANAELNATNGIFAWTPTQEQLGTNDFTVRVTDDGSPNLSDAKTFSVVVVVPPTILSVTNSDGEVTLTWDSITGQNYRVQYKTNLDESFWSDLPGDIATNTPTASKTDLNALTTQRFYRILVLP